MDEDIVIVMVRKADGEMYVFEFLPTVRNCQQVQRQAGRWAANPELSFSWEDSAKVCCELRRVLAEVGP